LTFDFIGDIIITETNERGNPKMTKHNTVRMWEDLTDQEQVYMWWDYNAANPENEISFSEFNEMMTGFIFE
jgi:hypothetical protein